MLRLKWNTPMLSVSWLATMSHSPDGSNWKWRGVAPRVCWYDGLCGAAEQIKSHDSPLLINLSVNVEFSPFLLETVEITVWWRSDISSKDQIRSILLESLILQRWAKRLTCFVKQQPGRARVNCLST